MKRGRNVHVPKSDSLKRQYHRYIAQQDYEPTVDERIDFPRSSQSGEELSPLSGNKRCPVGFGVQVSEHLKSNWVGWLIGAFVLVILYLVYDSKVAFAKFDTVLNRQTEDIKGLDSKADAGQEHNYKQVLQIQENRIGIQNLSNELGKPNTAPKEIVQ